MLLGWAEKTKPINWLGKKGKLRDLHTRIWCGFIACSCWSPTDDQYYCIIEQRHHIFFSSIPLFLRKGIILELDFRLFSIVCRFLTAFFLLLFNNTHFKRKRTALRQHVLMSIEWQQKWEIMSANEDKYYVLEIHERKHFFYSLILAWELIK